MVMRLLVVCFDAFCCVVGLIAFAYCFVLLLIVCWV